MNPKPDNTKPGAEVVIIGAGAVGLATALYALADGAEVLLLDRGPLGSGSSLGNAGLVVPSFYHPLCAPGVVAEGLGQLGDPEGFFAIKPRLDPALASWLIHFALNCRARKYGPKAAALARLNWESLKLHLEWALKWGHEYDFAQQGLLYVYADADEFEKGVQTLAEAAPYGFSGRVLEAGELKEYQPGLAPELLGGVYYQEEARLRPESFLETMARQVRAAGGRIWEGTEVYGFRRSGARITAALTTAGEIRADQFVLAAGAWLAPLALKLGKKLPVEGGKGISLTFQPAPGLLNQPLLMDCHCAATPFADALRVTGLLEIAGIEESLDPKRVAGVQRAVSRYMPWLNRVRPSFVWRGLRPCTSDGLPIMGRLAKHPNVVISGGHDQKGISLAPVSGRMTADILCGRDLANGLGPLLSPERF